MNRETFGRDFLPAGKTVLLDDLATEVIPLSPSASLAEILDRFLSEPGRMSLPVTESGRILGLLRRSCFFESDYVGRLGNAHLWNARKRASELCCFQPCLIAPAQTRVEEAAMMISSRTGAFRNDDICISRDGNYFGLISPSVLLEALRQDLECRVEERTAALAEATRIADTARHEAERANLAKSEFLSRMSHELRTPMNAILGFGQLLELENLLPDQQDSVAQIMRGGGHLLDLINEVLDISQIESGKLSLSLEAVPLSQVVTDALALVRTMLEEKKITLTEDSLGAAGAYVWADRQRLMQVLLNLLSNAIKYNRHAGQVKITITPWADETAGWRVSIMDTGPGIKPDQRTKLFQPFERLEAEITTVQGTGLGLALSKRLIGLMGGGIGMMPAPTGGCTFYFDLRAVESPMTTLERVDGSLEAENSNAESNQTTRILYIEDNLSNLRLVELLLARRGRVKVITAMQGAIGLELARDQCPDLILLDLHLPDLHGSEVLQKLRSEERTRDIPVVIISADATPGQIESLLAAGATAYLTKPLDLKRFNRTLDSILSTELTSASGHPA